MTDPPHTRRTGETIARGDPERPGLREGMRYVSMGLSTVLGLRRRGFFIPHRYAADLPPPGGRAAYDGLLEIFERSRPAFAAVIDGIEAHAAAFETIEGDGPPDPRWRQGWFPRLDAAAAYAMVRRLRPRRIVEVGSGHSTRFLARAVADGGIGTRITCVDPAPRAALAGLGVDHVACPAHAADPALFRTLGPGDVLFIDSSHVLMPGSDVDHLLNRAWPLLPAGAVVHFHDVFLPDDYPASWSWRGYNEQLGVAPLIAGGGADPLFSSHYVLTRMPDAVRGTVVARLPIMPGAVESSLWLEKSGAPGRGRRADGG